MEDDSIYIIGDQADEPQAPPPTKPRSTSKDQNAVLVILKNAISRNASDIHFQVGSYPLIRIDGVLSPLTAVKIITSEFMDDCADLFLNDKQKKALEENRQVDCSTTLPNFSHRFRMNFFYQRNTLSCAFRANPVIPPTMAQLGLPPMMANLAALPHGLVLITGATGSGKTTTLAALVDQMNHFRNAHIITIADPIEYIHKNRSCLLSQREIGSDATSYASALRVALREDPDIIVVEEIRDLETISMALTAAETGHLVFSTLHTNDVVQAIDRIIDIFPPDQQTQVRIQMAMSLQAVVSQVLLKKKNGPGRVAVLEIMPVTTPIRHLIRNSQTVQIYNVIATSRSQGMVLRSDALKDFVERGIISQESADECVVNTEIFRGDE
ncbi:MAG: PilT/PilU family type 4a pilus ATPase [Candidatus Omnitrophota bacterium]